MSEHRKRLYGLALSLAAGLALADAVYARFQGVLDTAQQTVITSTRSGIVVIFIPGFPLESILAGVSLGLGLILLLRRRRSRVSTSVSRGVA
jgi:hypothetical protein